MMKHKILPLILSGTFTITNAAEVIQAPKNIKPQTAQPQITPPKPVTVTDKKIVPDNFAHPDHKPVIIDNPSLSKTPIIQIAPANEKGISHNQYQELSTDQRGVIFSNNTTAVTNPLDATNPAIAANHRLKDPAKIIINEVTGIHPSELYGRIAVAGPATDVVISNPQGIQLNGASFFNSHHVMLTTGKPIVERDGLTYYYDIDRGQIEINKKGANFLNVDRVDVLAHSIKLNNKLWAKHSLNMVAGTFLASHSKLHITPMQAQSPKPEFAIDLANLGGMYAEKIHLVGTEKGIGVNSLGQQVSFADKGFMLDLEKQLIVDYSVTDNDLPYDHNRLHPSEDVIYQLNDSTDRIPLRNGGHIDFIYPKNPVNGGRIFWNKDNPKQIIYGADPSRIKTEKPQQNTPQVTSSPQPTKALLTSDIDVYPEIQQDDGSFSTLGTALGFIGGLLGGAFAPAIYNTLTSGATAATSSSPTFSTSGSTGGTASTQTSPNTAKVAKKQVLISSPSGSPATSTPGSSGTPKTPKSTQPSTAQKSPKTPTSADSASGKRSDWKIPSTLKRTTYWTPASEQHIFYGDKSGGGHLYGHQGINSSSFPHQWTPKQIKNVVDRVINNTRTVWRLDPKTNNMTTVFNTDSTSVRIVMNPAKARLITSYPLDNFIIAAPEYTMTGQQIATVSGQRPDTLSWQQPNKFTFDKEQMGGSKMSSGSPYTPSDTWYPPLPGSAEASPAKYSGSPAKSQSSPTGQNVLYKPKTDGQSIPLNQPKTIKSLQEMDSTAESSNALDDHAHAEKVDTDTWTTVSSKKKGKVVVDTEEPKKPFKLEKPPKGKAKQLDKPAANKKPVKIKPTSQASTSETASSSGKKSWSNIVSPEKSPESTVTQEAEQPEDEWTTVKSKKKLLIDDDQDDELNML